LVPGVPHALDRVDLVERAVRVGVEAHVVEDEELRLRTHVGGVGDARRLQVGLSLLGDVAGVTAVALTGHRVGDEAVDDRRLPLHERVDVDGVRVGDQDHVGFLDLLEPTHRGAVEAVTVGEVVLAQDRRRDRDVLHDARQVREAEVDELAAFVLDEGEDFFGGAFLHGVPPGWYGMSTAIVEMERRPSDGPLGCARPRRGAERSGSLSAAV
jgi:hypothetical protein